MCTPTGLIPWFSKTEGNTYATLLHHPFLFKGKPTHAQEVAALEVEAASAGRARDTIHKQGAMIGGRGGEALEQAVGMSDLPTGGAQHAINAD